MPAKCSNVSDTNEKGMGTTRVMPMFRSFNYEDSAHYQPDPREVNDLGVLKYPPFIAPHFVGNLFAGSTAKTCSIAIWISFSSSATLQILLNLMRSAMCVLTRDLSG